MLYHLSTIKGLKELIPKIPEGAVEEYEDVTTPRVCFSTSISGCLSALQNSPEKYYVYTPVKRIRTYIPSVNEVRDAQFTQERWYKKKIEVKCIGVIESSSWHSYKSFVVEDDEVWIHYYNYKWIKIY